MKTSSQTFKSSGVGKFLKDAILVVLFLALVAIPSGLKGQTFHGRIVGIVTDPSGADVATAKVTATNMATGVRYESVQTDSKGYYVVPDLPEGDYIVKIEVQGFKLEERSGIKVFVDQSARVDVQLAVGNTTQSVTVSGQAPLVNSESAEISSSIDRNLASDEMTGTGGYMIDLFFTAPGISSTSGPIGADYWNVNGSPTGVTAARLDGADIVLSGGGTNWYIQKPTPYELQDMKLESSNFSAEFAGFSQMNITSVSGTNTFHGTGYWVKTTPGLQARTFFEPTVSTFWQLSDAGGTVSGPIQKNKTFFTFSTFLNPYTNPQPAIYTFPTAAELEGNFAGFPTIYDPNTTTPNPKGSGYVKTAFPNNQIPTNRFDAVSQKMLSYLPLPNLAGNTNNFNNQLLPNINITDARGDGSGPYFATKIDENINDRNRLFGRYEFVHIHTNYADYFPGPAGQLSANLNYIHGWQLVTGDTFSISSRTLNEFRANVVTQLNVTAIDDTDYDSQLGLTGFGDGFPRAAITGQQSIAFGPATEPSRVAKNSRVFSDNLTFLRGSHTIKVGAGIRAEEYDNQAGYYQQGDFNFNGLFTSNLQTTSVANGFADFLLGLSSSVSAQLPTNRYGYRERNFYLFAQDDYKILPRLTMNIGLRYEWYGGLWEAFNRGSEFSPYVPNSIAEAYAPTGTLGGLVFAGPANHASFVNPSNNFMPRLGLAYQLNEKTVLRAGAGMYSAENNYAFGMSTLGFDPIPESLVTVNQIVPAMVMQSGNPQPLNFATYAHTSGLGNNLGVNWYPSHWPALQDYQFSLSLQRELGLGTMAELSFISTRGVHLWFPRSMDQVPQNELQAGTARDFSPYPQYTGVTGYFADGLSDYNALQFSVTHRFAHGVDILGNYTYSRNLNDTSATALGLGSDPVQNEYQTRAEWANADGDTPNIANVTLLYEIPTLSRSNGFVNRYVARGWQVNTILRMISGFPQNATASYSPGPNANAGTARPNCIANPNDGAPHTIEEWYNLSAFAAPASYTFGNCGRNVVRGPGFMDDEASVFKNTYFKSFLGENTDIQLRAECRNTFNHPNWGAPNMSIGSKAAGTITSELGAAREFDFAIFLKF